MMTERSWANLRGLAGALGLLLAPPILLGQVYDAAGRQLLSVLITNAGGASAVNIQDGGNSITVDGTVTTSPPANASTNLAQIVGTAVDVNSGNKSPGTLRVVLATDQPALTNKLLVTPDSVALPANQSVNVAQVGGTNTVTGGVAGLQAVAGNVAPDVAITANPLGIGGRASAVAPTDVGADGRSVFFWLLRSGALAVQQTYAGVLAAVGNGASSTGTPRVIWATDSPGIKNEDVLSADGDPGMVIHGRRKDTNATMTNGDGDYLPFSMDNYGVPSVSIRHPNAILCYISSTATTSTVVTGCSAPGAGLSIYITAVYTASSIATTTTNFTRIQYGTGGTCGTGTTGIFDEYAAAAFGSAGLTFGTAVKIPANNEVCFVNPGVGTRVVTITGFIAP